MATETPRVECVTSGNLTYHQRYGHKLVESFLKHVDDRIPLAYYHEAAGEFTGPRGFARYELSEDRRIVPRDLYIDTNFFEYLKAATPIVEAKVGPVAADPDKRVGPGRAARYTYLWDALTFGRKGYAFIDAARRARGRYLFWVDADIVFHKPMSETVFTDLFTEGAELVCFMRRAPHTETGFYGVDLESANGQKFVNRYAAYWESRAVFTLTEGWTDSHVFDAARTREDLDIKVRNLSTQDYGHVMATGPLAPYFDHRKGPRKQKGFSPERKV